MKIISVLNQKGGAGKTTLSTNLTRAFILGGIKAMLVDSDPQGSARDWRASNKNDGAFPVLGLDRDTLDKDIFSVSNYDIIIIDGAPQISKLSASAIRCSDLVVIPVQPSPYDIWACEDLVAMVKARREATPSKPKAVFLLSRVLKNTKLEIEAKETLKHYSIPILKSYTTQRVVYPTTANEGGTVFEATDQKAIDEIKNIKNEIYTYINNGINSQT